MHGRRTPLAALGTALMVAVAGRADPPAPRASFTASAVGCFRVDAARTLAVRDDAGRVTFRLTGFCADPIELAAAVDARRRLLHAGAPRCMPEPGARALVLRRGTAPGSWSLEVWAADHSRLLRDHTHPLRLAQTHPLSRCP